MNLKELQNAVETIQIKEDMQRDMIQNVKNKKGQKVYWMKKAAAAAVVVAAIGAASIPVSAFVNSVVRERMEKLPQEDLDTMTAEVDNQQAEANSQTRAYTEREEHRMEELYLEYQTGVFPEGELLRVDSVEEAKQHEFCFLTTEAVFYLPDRELTDEELLEIIDLNQKKNYALEKRAEELYADEIAAQKEEESKKIAKTVEAGGISKEEAVEASKGWLNKIWGRSAEGLEVNANFGDDFIINGETGFYEIFWYENSMANQQYLLFIDPEDGALAEMVYSCAGLVDGESPALAEADSQLSGLKDKAVSFIEETMGFAYEDIYYVYYICDEKNLNTEVKFIFVQEDGTAYSVMYSWDGTLIYYERTDFESQKQRVEDGKETVKLNEEVRGNEDAEVRAVFEKF
ncbi:MAG: hypothetical protein NC419_06335 [Muribaculaceae bacterium]|nr:hypothetical protein [Muribaculaceae bacterium]